jgi:UDP-glucose 4-epimerase
MVRLITKYAIQKNSYLIFASTSDVYGNSENFSEDESITIGPPTNERYSYALSKLYGEQFILNAIAQEGLRSTIFRIFGCASWRSNYSWSGGHVPLFIHKAVTGDDIIIHGDGMQTRSICHAIDIAAGLVSTLNNIDKVHGQIINLGTDQQTCVRYIAEYVVTKINSSSNIVLTQRSDIFGDYKEIIIRFANTQKAKDLLDFKINYTTEQVIDEMIDKYTHNI